MEGTDVGASSLHNMFDFDGAYESKLDFSRPATDKVAALISLQVLFLDEVSMLDVDIWEAMTKLLGIADHARHSNKFLDDSDQCPASYEFELASLDAHATRDSNYPSGSCLARGTVRST